MQKTKGHVFPVTPRGCHEFPDFPILLQSVQIQVAWPYGVSSCNSRNVISTSGFFTDPQTTWLISGRQGKHQAPLRKIDCDDEGETMEALKLLSPEELASPRGLEDTNKAVKYVSTIIAAMRKPCYYKLKSTQ